MQLLAGQTVFKLIFTAVLLQFILYIARYYFYLHIIYITILRI